MARDRSDPDAPLILIVDDIEDTRLMYAAFLEYRGFRAAAVNNAKAAFAVVAAGPPDLIIMDFGMPGIDGLSATRQIATDPATAHIPVIVLTGHVELVNRAAAKAAGARRLIAKPCIPETLEAEIRAVLAGDTEFRAVPGIPAA